MSDLTGPKFEPQTSPYRVEHDTIRTTGQFAINILLIKYIIAILNLTETVSTLTQSCYENA